jgi:hypothetical protein
MGVQDDKDEKRDDRPRREQRAKGRSSTLVHVVLIGHEIPHKKGRA